MFIGEYTHAVDDKGRIQVPKKFRRELREAVVSRGLDGCLFLHPKRRWEEFERELIALPLTKRDARSFARHMFAGAVSVSVDSVGRILVPRNLRNYAGIKKDAAVIGVGNRIEIWDVDRWNRYRAGVEEDSEAVAERLAELGL
jgi:MraZ protein